MRFFRCIVITWVLLLINAISFANSINDFVYVPFDQSMQFNKKGGYEEYALFKNLYETNIKTALEGKNHCQPIPKKIHQIWIGPHAIPDVYAKATEMIKKLHPDWEYKLWRDEDVESFDFSAKDLYNKASSYTEKADILRYSILEKFGGVYLDVGVFTLKPLDFLVENFSFFAHLESGAINNNITGTIKNLPIMQDALFNIRNHWDEKEKEFVNLIHDANTKLNRGTIKSLAVSRTLMPFNKAILNYVNNIASHDSKQCIVILPITYNGIRFKVRLYDPVKTTKIIDGKKYDFRQNHEETIAMKVFLKKSIADNLTKNNINSKIPFFTKIRKNIRYFFTDLIEKYYSRKALKKYEQ